MGAVRASVGGVVLLAWARLSGHGIRLSRAEFTILLLSGLLMWTGGNGMVMWAEQRIHSAYAALLVGTTPMWVALIEAVIDRRVPTLLLVCSLAAGFLGTGFLSVPIISAGARADVWSVVGLVLASLSWGGGSILLNRRKVGMASRVSAAYQQLFGCLGFAVMSLVWREPFPRPSAQAWWAVGYLIVFGSVIAFTCYIQALRSLPTGIVFTYSYVNPVIAVFLGWVVLNEPITGWTLGGAGFVLLGVAGVFHERLRPRAVSRDRA
jgi:drug/metabolite transporter (DMT)-like permease